ncbi:hypothetical protein FY036_12600 [Mesorhizobium microcysteis]|uniref:Uncharacterized protein n=1 Tax=Neoaquamicrobium microcysteis TaxID=2682781 RepID=A0A5D4GVX3_9HYPH|nr:hypothetical protein [Mesorhizobium microcysteis]TYR31929.1 hypothetical protein FY036_12600 [Mesorhizobium microcysteis]
MNRTVSAFLLVGVLTALLAVLSIALVNKGYGFGALGSGRLDNIASAATFVPLAAIYSLAAALMMLLPLRAAGFVHANAAGPLYSTALVLLSTIIGVQAARFAFGSREALSVLIDWQFIFAFAIIAAHLTMNELRRNVLLRTIFFVVFLAATLACLYWTFRL